MKGVKGTHSPYMLNEAFKSGAANHKKGKTEGDIPWRYALNDDLRVEWLRGYRGEPKEMK